MNKNNIIRFLWIAIMVAYILIFKLGYIRSLIIGMPYGIEIVDRVKNDIPPIPIDWSRYPKDNKLSATQIWIDIDTIYPRHYAKEIIMHNVNKSYKNISHESDRYILNQDKYYQTDLVIAVNYNKLKLGEDFRFCKIEKIRKIDTSDYCFNWFADAELIEEIDFEKAKEILIDKNIDY